MLCQNKHLVTGVNYTLSDLSASEYNFKVLFRQLSDILYFDEYPMKISSV